MKRIIFGVIVVVILAVVIFLVVHFTRKKDSKKASTLDQHNLGGKVFILQNVKNNGCLTNANNRKADQNPVYDIVDTCDIDNPDPNALWKFNQSNNSSDVYTIQNGINLGCLTHANNGRYYGPIQNWGVNNPEIFCDPNSDTFNQQSAWKVIPTGRENIFIFQNMKNNGCLTHANSGKGTGPIQDWPEIPFCDPNGKTQSQWLLKEVKIT